MINVGCNGFIMQVLVMLCRCCIIMKDILYFLLRILKWNIKPETILFFLLFFTLQIILSFIIYAAQGCCWLLWKKTKSTILKNFSLVNTWVCCFSSVQEENGENRLKICTHEEEETFYFYMTSISIYTEKIYDSFKWQ